MFSHGDYNAFYEHLYEVSTDGSRVRLIPGIQKDNADDLRELGAAASISPDLSRLTYADFQHDSWLPWAKDYNWEIVTSAPDGSDKRRITNLELSDLSPVWAPDGSRIAFLSSRNGAYNVFTMAPDGSGVRDLAPSVSGGEFSHLVWSPDSRRIAFALATPTVSWELYAVGSDGSCLTRLGHTISLPGWSPDSSRLAFLQQDGNKTTLYTVGADGAGLKKVHELDDEFTGEDSNVTNNLAWSPDGTKILLSGTYMIGVVEIDSSEFRVLTSQRRLTGSGIILYSSWSPDGSKIAVNAATNSGNAANGFDPVLYIMDPDGSNKKILARYSNNVGYYDDNRVAPAHGEAWPAKFDQVASALIPKSVPVTVAKTPTLEVPTISKTPPTPAPTELTNFSCAKESGGDCASRDVSMINLTAASIGGSAYGDNRVSSVEDVLDKGLFLLDESPTHISVRATVLNDSVRCAWRGVARTAGQREEAIRFWLGLSDEETLPSPVQVESDFMSYVNQMSPRYRDYVEASYKAVARGGLSNDIPVLTCYADYIVQEYLVGAGPTTLTMAYDLVDDTRSYDLYRRSHEAGEFGPPTVSLLMNEAEYSEMLMQIVVDAENLYGQILEGRESVVFLAPMGAYNAIAVEAWQVVAQWDLQTDDEGTVQAVRYGVSEHDPEYTQTLANLKSRITTAAASDAFAGQRIASTSGLTQYYRDIGAYGDITPDDGSDETFTPAQPPPAATPNIPLKPMAPACVEGYGFVVPNEALIGLAEGSHAEADDIAAKVKGKVLMSFFGGKSVHIRFDSTMTDLHTVITILSVDPRVRYAEPNSIASAPEVKLDDCKE